MLEDGGIVVHDHAILAMSQGYVPLMGAPYLLPVIVSGQSIQTIRYWQAAAGAGADFASSASLTLEDEPPRTRSLLLSRPTPHVEFFD